MPCCRQGRLTTGDSPSLYLFFFSSRRRHTRWNCDWSSDVCSSDLRRRSDKGHRDQRCVIREHATGKATDLAEHRVEEFGCRLMAVCDDKLDQTIVPKLTAFVATRLGRSEERRVGKECRSRRSRYQ